MILVNRAVSLTLHKAASLSRIRTMNRQMQGTVSSSKPFSCKTEHALSDSDEAKATNGASVSETRTYRRKKRLKQEVLEPLEKDSGTGVTTQKLCELPDIEKFAYKNNTGSPSSNSRTVFLVLARRSTETSFTVTSVKTAGYMPENWVKVLEGIRQMRSSEEAPVDSMGCDKAGSFLPPTERRIAVLLGALLSSQTKDQVNNAAIHRLHQNGLLTPAAVDKADESTIRELIYPIWGKLHEVTCLSIAWKDLFSKGCNLICCGLRCRTPKNLNFSLQIYIYNGDIPSSLDDLLSLPGIVPKMAHLIQSICVDTHVHRICNRLGWVSRQGTKQKTTSPEETRVALQQWLPKEEWVAINPLLLDRLGTRNNSRSLRFKQRMRNVLIQFNMQVGFGQSICTPLRPRCEACSVTKLCPAAFKETSSPSSKLKKSSNRSKEL